LEGYPHLDGLAVPHCIHVAGVASCNIDDAELAFGSDSCIFVLALKNLSTRDIADESWWSEIVRVVPLIIPATISGERSTVIMKEEFG
jgi:hypothetical protein